MSDFGDPGSQDDHVIRITPADAASAHVDDLLKRQANLRGEQGITARRKRRWYYRNWFLFMLAGILGAVLAWAILEPHFDDFLYLQGTVDLSDAGPELDGEAPLPGNQALDLPGLEDEISGFVTVADEPILILSDTKLLLPGGGVDRFDLSTLTDGDEIGVHVQYEAIGPGVSLAFAGFVDATPPPRTAATATLSQLQARQMASGLLLFPLVAALAGLAIASADGLVCRLWRRVLLAGIVGLLVGFLGGFVSTILANLIYAPISLLALRQTTAAGELTTLGFLTQMSGRGLAWMMAGVAMGLGQGIALRSGRLFLYGLLGGAIGGLLGGLLFDPIDCLLVGVNSPSSHVARLVGIGVIGGTVGLMIGVVELLARDAWLQMIKGPLAGKEFLIFKDLLQIGASPRSDIYLFNDAAVGERHATIRAAADQYEIEVVDEMRPVLVNGRAVVRSRLRHGDQITLGETIFSFHRRRTD